MKVVVFTANQLRHKFVANVLSAVATEALVVCETKAHDAADIKSGSSELEKHFYNRYETENWFFRGHDLLQTGKVLPLTYKEANLSYVYGVVKKFAPDMMFCFGASLIKEPLLSLLSPGRFINLHLGLSPYYTGGGTNFWPWVNEELQYLGATLMHIDAGVDTGDIICHVRPGIVSGDDVHIVGCRIIEESALAMVFLMQKAKNGIVLSRTKQWKIENPRYYKKSNVTDETVRLYQEKLQNGVVKRYIENLPNLKPLKLVSL